MTEKYYCAGMEQLKSVIDKICDNPYIYHFSEISLHCFFIQTTESHTFINEYISDRLISSEVFFPRADCHNAVYTLENSSNSALARLIYKIDNHALTNQPEGICIGIKLNPEVTASAKDQNLIRFFSVLAGYKKVCWIFFTENMQLCDTRGLTDLIYSSFTGEKHTVHIPQYTPQQMAGAVLERLGLSYGIICDNKTTTALADMLKECKTMNQAFCYIPPLLKYAVYNQTGLTVSAETILKITGDKNI